MQPLPLKLIAGLSVLATLAGCDAGPPRVVKPDANARHLGGISAGSVDAAEQFGSWAPVNQLAFLAGKVSAARQLFMVGDTASAKRLLDGLGRQAASADAGALRELGFEPQRLDALADAMTLGRPDGDVAELLESTLGNLSGAIASSESSPKETVNFLMIRSAEAYEQAVRFGEIVDLDAYQTAYGNAVAARELVSGLEGQGYEQLSLELGMLVMMWPTGGPLAARTPPPEFRMAEQFARVRLVLAEEP